MGKQCWPEDKQGLKERKGKKVNQHHLVNLHYFKGYFIETGLLVFFWLAEEVLLYLHKGQMC